MESLSLERYPSEVNQILSAWSSLFHPAILEKTQRFPGWENSSAPQNDTVSQIAVVPPCCESNYLKSWFQAKEEMGTLLVRDKENRTEIVEDILERLQLREHGFDPELVLDFYALGTSYFLTEIMTRQMRYMSMLDESQLKTALFDAIRAARSGKRSETYTALRSAFELIAQSKEYFYPGTTNFLNLTLTSDSTLGESLQKELRETDFTNLFLPCEVLEELCEKEPESLRVLRSALDPNTHPPRPGEKQPGSVQLIGDDRGEAPLPMLPILEIADRLVLGILYYKEKLGVRPEFYARARKGLTPVLPQLLHLSGFKGAIHFTPQDGWKISGESQSKIFWSGTDGTKIDALLQFPMNAARHETYFLLPKKMGYSMNTDQSSTFVLAHYPERKCVWLGDLLRANRFAPVFGKFNRIEEYFQNTKYVGTTHSFGFDKYRMNYLSQSIRENRPGPVSDWADYYRLQAKTSALQTLLALHAGIGKDRSSYENSRERLDEFLGPIFETLENRLFGPWGPKEENSNGQEPSETKTGLPESPSPNPPGGAQSSRFSLEKGELSGTPEFSFSRTEEKLREIYEMYINEFSYAVYDKPIEEIEKLSDAKIQKIIGILVVNPLSFSRTTVVDISELPELPQTGGNILLAKQFVHGKESRKEAVLELPPLGSLWIGPKEDDKDDGSVNKTVPEKSPPLNGKNEKISEADSGLFSKIKSFFLAKPEKSSKVPALIELVDERIERRGHKPQNKTFYLLRNDYFELRIDTLTGEMRSLKSFHRRGNRFAHHLALRVPQEDRAKDSRKEDSPNFGYTIISADHFEILSSGPITGRLQIQGRMMRQDGTHAANYRQIYTFRRYSRVVEIEAGIDPILFPGDNPWDSYYAARFAWNDPLSDLYAGVHGGAYPVESQRLESPEFVDIRDENGSITLLCGGLPFHRHLGGNRMDTILIPRGESSRTFRWAIGLDLPSPYQAAEEFLLSGFDATGMIPIPEVPEAGFFRLSERNVVVLRVEPLFEGKNPGEISETLSGFRLVLLETSNHHTRFTLQSRLPIAHAIPTDLLRTPGAECRVEGEKVHLEIRPRGILPLELYLKSET